MSQTCNPSVGLTTRAAIAMRWGWVYDSRMRRSLRLLRFAGAILFLGVFGSQLRAQTVPLSLEACIQMALDAPSPVTVARLERDIADQGRVAARAGFLPRAGLAVDHIYNSPGLDDPTTASYIASNAVRELAGLATVVGDIDTSGRIRAEYQRARANQDIAGANLAMAERNLRGAVAGAYYRLVLSRKLVEVFQAMVDEATDFEARTTLLMESGEASRADVVKATAQTALFRRQFLTAELNADLANQELAAFWTDDVASRVDVVDVLDQTVQTPPTVSTGAQVYMARPEFRLFDAEERAFEADARRARADLLPNLQLAFQWGVDRSLPGWSMGDRGYAVLASLDFTLFDWSRTTSQVRQAQARADEVAASRIAATRQYSREYQSALARVRGIFEQISLSRIETTAAEEDLLLSRVRYEGGEGPALDVVTSQRQLADARSGYYTAIAEYLGALEDLNVATGQ